MITTINEFKSQMNEKLQSDILRQIINSEKKIKQNLYHIDLSNITDDDFIELSGQEARKSTYNDYYLFWFNNNEFLAYSHGKNIYYMKNDHYYNSRRGGGKYYPSSLQLVNQYNDSLSVYALSKEIGQGTRQDKRNKRNNDRFDALALQDPNDIKEKNMKRYRSILATKNSGIDEIDEIVKYFMKKYSNDLSNITLSDDKEIAHTRYSGGDNSVGEVKKQIYNINSKLTNLLNKYDTYIDIIEDAKKGRMYNHQIEAKKNIQALFKKWKDADVVDNQINIYR